MRSFKYFYIGFIALLAMGCNKENVEFYSSEDGIYFYKSETDAGVNEEFTQIENTVVQFFLLSPDVKRDTALIRIYTFGPARDYDRPFELMQVNKGDSAGIQGTHYLPFNEMKSNMVIKAGEVMTDMPFILLRDASLEDMVYKIGLKFVPNEYFPATLEDQSTFTVFTSDLPMKTTDWDTTWAYCFGTWSMNKMYFLRDHVVGYGFDWDNTAATMDITTRNYWQQLAQSELDAYNNDPENTDTPLTNEDGSVMTFK